jgi:hypothetical protein
MRRNHVVGLTPPQLKAVKKAIKNVFAEDPLESTAHWFIDPVDTGQVTSVLAVCVPPSTHLTLHLSVSFVPPTGALPDVA